MSTHASKHATSKRQPTARAAGAARGAVKRHATRRAGRVDRSLSRRSPHSSAVSRSLPCRPCPVPRSFRLRNELEFAEKGTSSMEAKSQAANKPKDPHQARTTNKADEQRGWGGTGERRRGTIERGQGADRAICGLHLSLLPIPQGFVSYGRRHRSCTHGWCQRRAACCSAQ